MPRILIGLLTSFILVVVGATSYFQVECSGITDDESSRTCSAAARNLPETARWTDIANYDNELDRKREARKRGLPTEASWTDIGNYDNELDRKREARKRGLPTEASWTDIGNYDLHH